MGSKELKRRRDTTKYNWNRPKAISKTAEIQENALSDCSFTTCHVCFTQKVVKASNRDRERGRENQ